MIDKKSYGQNSRLKFKNGKGAAERKAARWRMLEAQNWHCCTCGVRLDGEGPPAPDSPTFEHVLPYRMGGRATVENGVFTCLRCNSADTAWVIWQQFCQREGLPVWWHLENAPSAEAAGETAMESAFAKAGTARVR